MKRTRITLTVLSEGHIPESMDLEGIVQQCTVGDYVQASETRMETDLTDEQMAAALYEAEVDPSFFLLDV